MPITEEMVEARRGWIGSSDVAAILGVSKYNNAYGVWLEKTGQLIPESNSKASKAGNRFESGVLDEAEETLGLIERNVHLKAAGLPFPLASNMDGQVVATGKPVEGKTAGLFGPLDGEWGDEGTDQIPEPYIAQSQAHLLVSNKELCHVPTFLAGRGFVMFEVPRNEEVIKYIVDRCGKFWEHVQKGTAPEFKAPPLSVVKRFRRQPNKIIDIPAEKFMVCQQIREHIREAEKAKDQADAELLTALGDAEAGKCSHGTVSYNLIDRKGYTVAPTSYRSLKFKKS
jgi:putative phage-type endonuclease